MRVQIFTPLFLCALSVMPILAEKKKSFTLKKEDLTKFFKNLTLTESSLDF